MVAEKTVLAMDFFNTGVSAYMPPNRGLLERTHQPEDIGEFRSPTLPNIPLTGPYMHDGSLATFRSLISRSSDGPTRGAASERAGSVR